MQTSADDGNGKLELLMYIDKTVFKTSPIDNTTKMCIATDNLHHSY